MNLSETAENIIMASWSDGTKKQYGTYARKWLKYCSDNHMDYCRASVPEVIEFLTDMFKNSKFQYSTFNTVRSMLSSMVEPRDGITATSTVARWIKETLSNSGIDTTTFTANSTRVAYTSLSKAKGIGNRNR